jgi:hypothetical protein
MLGGSCSQEIRACFVSQYGGKLTGPWSAQIDGTVGSGETLRRVQVTVSAAVTM